MDELMYLDATKPKPLTQVTLSEHSPIVGWGVHFESNIFTHWFGRNIEW